LFSHGMCPECFDDYMKDLNERFPDK